MVKNFVLDNFKIVLFCPGRWTRLKKITLPDETVNFCTKEIIFRALCIAEMNFLAMDKMFCLRQKIFV